MFSCFRFLKWSDSDSMDQSSDNSNTSTPVFHNDIQLAHHLHQVDVDTHHCHQRAHHYFPAYNQHLLLQNRAPLLLNIGNHPLYSRSHDHFQFAYNDYPHQHIPRSMPLSANNSPIHSPQYPIAGPSRSQFVASRSQSAPQAASVSIQASIPSPPPNHQVEQAAEQSRETPTQTPTRSTGARPKIRDADKMQLRSPSARRPENAPVAMQGWLHKQGSDGLMLWKKRWFVLSEYCLFYYKSLEEEKLLGSILLPSYTVSVCVPEDRITKKFAFKCEHINMRTYILAADTYEIMLKWIHALNLACTLQNNIETPTNNQKLLNLDLIPSKPASLVISPSNSNSFANTNSPDIDSPKATTSSGQPEISEFTQHLYANAPPKPRRVSEGYCSPVPELLETYPYPRLPSIIKSPSNSYSRYIDPRTRPMFNDGNRTHLFPQHVDRRTPDTYGRSNLTRFRNPIDYEDVYAEQNAYRRPLSPMTDNALKKQYPSVNLNYSPIKGYEAPVLHISRPRHPDVTKNTAYSISRPHSADFLEYKIDKVQPTIPNTATKAQQTRPRSSMDINLPSTSYDRQSQSSSDERNQDNDYFFSEKTYADKMRKSSQYLHKLTNKFQPVDSPEHKNYNDRYNASPNRNYPYNYPLRDAAEGPLSANMQPVRSRSALSEGSLIFSQDLETDLLERQHPIGEESPPDCSGSSQHHLPRSASAGASHSDTEEPRSGAQHKKGKRRQLTREESMQRLLLWKQRMLISPLTQRGIPLAPLILPRDLHYISPQHSLQRKLKKNLSTRRSCQSLVHDNSYSSDDEENGERSSKTSMHSQAGRTLDTFPNNSDSLSHAPFTSTTDLILPEEFETSTSILSKLCNNSNLNEISPDTSADSFNITFQNFPNSNFSENGFNTDISTLEGNYMPMSAKTNILQSKSDTNSEITVVFNDVDAEENHYVEMTQALDSSLIEITIDNDLNEQQQYETICFSDSKTEPVYMEVPVTKNLNNYADKDLLPDILKSPKRYHNHKNSKSDSSDADDEASKDLESLENCNNPRFSLSDTFRPASYYLGVNKTISELQDSSDSELMSPPPIPTSSPPLESEDYVHTNRLKKEKCLHTAVQERTTNQYSNSKDKEAKVNLEPKATFLTLKDLKEQGGSPTSSIRILEQTNRFSDNGDPIGELSISNVRRVTAELSTPIDFKTISYRHENLEEVHTEHEDGPAYENFMIAKKVCSVDTNNQICTAVKRHLISPNNLTDMKLRFRPESGCSDSIDDSIITNSNRSTPLVSSIEIVCEQMNAPQNIPYYYSDIPDNADLKSSLTLNNQRESVNGSKKDITHIINPLKCQEDINGEDQDTLAAEARSVSADFLNLTDKTDSIDKKNIYESNTFKRRKADGITLTDDDYQQRQMLDQERLYQIKSRGEKCVQKSYSLEGLLENVLCDNIAHEIPHRTTIDNITSEGSYLWEEDSIWREQLRSVSQRHTKSMDDLDSIDHRHETSQKKQPRAITREVKYVNDILFKYSDHGHHKPPKDSKTEIKKKGSFVIDRETLRQWDLLSSAPSDDQLLQIVDPPAPQNLTVVDLGEGNSNIGDNGNIHETASGSISNSTRDSSSLRDNFPGASSSRASVSQSVNMQTRSATNLNESPETFGNDNAAPIVWPKAIPYSGNAEQEYLNSQRDIAPKAKMNVYAGELLGRTHEELVLLLIQLRRQQAQTSQAIECCYNEIDTLQLHMHKMDPIKKLENLEKLEIIKHNLMELERQYEEQKPLINLVDNMVKLGCLYKNPVEKQKMDKELRERLEFNQQIQERRLLADERREWNRLDPNNGQLQEKVNKLYYLDRVIHDESRNLCNLQRNKENIERALIELRDRSSRGLDTPEEAEEARQQRFLLESELRKIHSKLAHNSKKLEESVTRNSRLEQELVLMKRKLRNLKYQRMSPQVSNAGLLCCSGTNQALDTDFQKMQQRIADLQKQREELSLQVRQLTDRSLTPHAAEQINKHQSSVNEAQTSQPTRRRPRSFWRETDLDTMMIIDHGYSSYPNASASPLYINTNIRPFDAHELSDRSLKSSDSTSDDAAMSYNPLEKQEIKTVRIVKRESERRQRDREKTFNGKCDSLTEDDDSSQNSSVLFRPSTSSTLPQQIPPFDNLHHSLPDRGNRHKQAELSPIFKSEAARQIITEVVKKVPSAQEQRRAVPKEHRRHHTAPHEIPPVLGNLDDRRARDDLDIERALRQRNDAPDIVRSTLSNKELKYNEETIDNILSTPNKILIPERYVPEQLPQPTAEEQEKRKKKVESIKKMLSDTAIISTPSTSSNNAERSDAKSNGSTIGAAPSIVEEKKQREHLLHLNQILAKQVMEMSKVVAARSLAILPVDLPPPSTDEDDDSSPVAPLPLVQQRENYYS